MVFIDQAERRCKKVAKVFCQSCTHPTQTYILTTNHPLPGTRTSSQLPSTRVCPVGVTLTMMGEQTDPQTRLDMGCILVSGVFVGQPCFLGQAGRARGVRKWGVR